MADALGIDLRVAVCAAARRRRDEVVPCRLGEVSDTADAVDLMPPGAGAVADAVSATGAMLAAVADRALAAEPHDARTEVAAVGVAFAVTPDDGPRRLAELAAASAFPAPLLVPRPVGVAAWHLHHTPRTGQVRMAVFDVDAGSVAVALVHRGRDGIELAGLPASLPPAGDDVDLAAHLDGAVGLLVDAIADAGLTSADLDAIVLAGEPVWLDQLAVQAGVATGVPAVVEPQPGLAAALGAALLAGADERRLDAAGLALLGPAMLANRLSPPPGEGGLGTLVGQHLVEPGGGLGAAAGTMLKGPSGDGDGIGDLAADALQSAGGGDKASLERGMHTSQLDKSGGSAGGGGGLLAGLKAGRGPVLLGVLGGVAALVILGAAVVAGGGGGGGDEASDVETGGSEVAGPDDGDPGDESDDTASSTAVSTTSVPGSTTVPEDPETPGEPVSGVPTPAGPAAPGDPPSSPGTTAGTTTTAPRDTTPPVISALVASPTDINESGFEFCTLPTTSAATARVTDASGISSVTISYGGNGHTGGGAMSLSGASYTGTIGPFPDSQLGVRETASVNFTVAAVDTAGNQSTSSSKITLHGC